MKLFRNLLVFCFLAHGGLFFNMARAQTYVTIPDANFAAYLHAWIPSAINGNQLDTSSAAVTTFTAMSIPSSANVSDLTGIQYFHSLKSFSCSGNSITWLPPMPDSVTTLGFSQTEITNLSFLPKRLSVLSCTGNPLTSLPQLPLTLQTLVCNQNNIATLPSLPEGLVTLNCADNLVLNALPFLPKSLKQLYCPNNQLTSILSFPDSLQILEAYNNKIACFPPFPNTLTQIHIFNNSFTCLPNYVNAMNAITLFGPPLSSFPMCNIDNPNNCPISKDAPTTVIVPNIFTPNEDGVNDEFFIKASNATDFNCKIYDRWGNQIYQWNDLNGYWNGQDKIEGVYYYVATYIDNSGKARSKTGFVQLLR